MTDEARSSGRGPRLERTAARRLFVPPALRVAATAGLILAAHALVMLGRPLLTTDMAQDTFIFIDAAHRVQRGLVPHLDFVTGLGALNFYGPALWGMIDDPFRSFALFHVLALALVLAVAIYAALTRALDGFAATILILYLGAAVGAPSNLGDPPWALSFAMWYNRVAWGLLLVGAVLVLEPRPTNAHGIAIGDGLVILLIGLVTFYLKITYAAVAAALFGFALVMVPHLRRPGIAAALGAGVALLGIELATNGLNTAYLRDLIAIAAVNGTPLLDPTRLLPAYWEIAYEFLFATLAVLLVLKARIKATWTDLGFVLILAVGSNYLHSTSVQERGLVALFAVPLLAYVRAVDIAPRRVTAGLAAIVIAFGGPELIARYASLAHYAATDRASGYPFAVPPRLADGMIVGDVDPEATHRFLARLVAGEPREAVLAERAAHHGPRPDARGTSQAEYAYVTAQGALALQDLVRLEPEPVVVLDFANAISPILGLPPARGDYAWFHLGRNVDEEHFPDPAALFANARYVMAPEFSTNPDTVAFLTRTYEPYLADHFDLVRDGPLWRVWSRRPTPSG